MVRPILITGLFALTFAIEHEHDHEQEQAAD